MAYYFQDDWKFSRRLTLNLGLRYEYESGFIDAGFLHPLEGQAPFFNSRTRQTPKLSLGPRVGFAYDVFDTGKTVVRGGFGIYYDTAPWEVSYIDRTFDGVKYSIDAFFPTTVNLNDAAFSVIPPPGGFAINGEVSQPYTEQFSIGFGQQLPRGIVLDVSALHVLGLHGWMTRELNPQGFDVNGVFHPAPFPNLGLFSSFETLNISHYDALQLSARKNLDRYFQLQLSYTYSKAISLSDDIFEPGVPQDSNNLFADKGPTLRDARHRFVLSGIVRAPLGIQVSSISALQSGRPFDITTGVDNNGDGHLKDRPAGAGRNSGRAAPTYIWDMRVARPFKIGERVEISPTADIFNVVNHANFDAESFTGTLNAGCGALLPPVCGTLQNPGSQFGKPSDIIAPARQFQLGLRVTF